MTRKKLPKYAEGDYFNIGVNNPLSGQTQYTDYTPQTASPYYTSNNLNSLSTPKTQQPNFFQTQNGQALGQVANMAAQALPSPNIEGKTNVERSTDQAGLAVASAIGPWWGALGKLGVTASDAVRKDDLGSHARGWIGDTLNPFHQFNSLREGDSREKVTAFLNPVLSSHFAADRRRKKAEERELVEDIGRRKNSDAILANYPIYGTGKYGMKFPNGGALPYPTTLDADVEVLASNIGQYNGPTHDNGGIPLDINGDASPEIEIENKEVVKDDMVLSNRLKPSKTIKEAIKKTGVQIRKGDTYATLAARIGKKKGDYEEGLTSTIPGSKNSSEIMTNRLDASLDMLFMDQEARKFKANPVNKYPGGGTIPSTGVTGPIYSPQDPRTSLEQNRLRAINNLNTAQQFKNIVSPIGMVSSSDYSELTNRIGTGGQQVGGGMRGYIPVDPAAIQRADSVINAGRPFLQPTQTLTTRAKGGYIPKAEIGRKLPALSDYWINNPVTGQSNRYRYNTIDPNVLDTGAVRQPVPETFAPRKFDWRDYTGDIAAGIGTAANQIAINNMETQYTPDTVDLPINTYTDRSNYLTSLANQQFSAASRGINSGSAQDNLALKSNLYAKTISGLNQALDSEFQRKDAYSARFNELVNRTNTINANIQNQGKLVSMDNRNKKRAQTQANVDNLIRSYIGNQAVRDYKSTEFAKNQLIASMAGTRGVDTRLLSSLTPEVRRQLGYQ